MAHTNRHTLKATTLKRLDTLRLLRGFDRKAHFAAGGTPADWRGEHSVGPDKRRESKRKACRGPCDTDNT